MAVRRLANRMRFVWMVPQIVFLLIVWLLGTGAAFAYEELDKTLLFGGLLALTAIIGIPSYALAELKHRSFTYELKEDGIVIRRGIFTHHLVMIPYTKIQNIRTERTVVEQALGLVHMHIETANAPRSEEEPAIPGIRYEERDALISEIMDNVKAVREGRKPRQIPGPKELDVADILLSIKEELQFMSHEIRGLREDLAKKRK
ncbi:MAG: PH domain-containing protein [Candidatus Micrarchaeia archaeon]